MERQRHAQQINKEEFMSFRGGEKSKERFKGTLYLWARAKKTSEIVMVEVIV